jgi:hypothetical protein
VFLGWGLKVKSLISRLRFNARVAKGILSAVPAMAKVAVPALVDSVNQVIREMEDIADCLERFENPNEGENPLGRSLSQEFVHTKNAGANTSVDVID